MTESRTKKSIRNVVYSFLTYFVTLLVSFINRTVFIYFLSTEYLGLNGLFSNILSFLALAELGIGTAINYALYKPLQENNYELVKSLMKLYKKMYIIIGVSVFAIGGVLTPFLQFFIKDMPDGIDHIHLYFVLYVFNTGISYFYTYKRSLIICDQKEYISSITTAVSSICLSVFQIIALYLTHSYILYVSLMIVCTICENMVISHIANRLYPYLKEKTVEGLNCEVSNSIRKNVFALFFHKIGTVIVFATDNIIISKFIGLTVVGFYSNYTMIVSPLNTLIGKIFNSLIASIGNIATSNDKEHLEIILNRIIFANVWIYGFSAICLVSLLQDFIILWLGENFLLSSNLVIIISVNFYISGVRKSVLIYRNAIGLFWYDRYKPIIESALNIVLSIPFAIYFGIEGVLLGTIGSSLLIPFWMEAYVLYKYYFEKGVLRYLFRQILYAIQVVFVALATYVVVSFLPHGGIFWFVMKLFTCVSTCLIMIVFISCKREEYCYFYNLFKTIVYQKKEK